MMGTDPFGPPYPRKGCLRRSSIGVAPPSAGAGGGAGCWGERTRTQEVKNWLQSFFVSQIQRGGACNAATPDKCTVNSG